MYYFVLIPLLICFCDITKSSNNITLGLLQIPVKLPLSTIENYLQNASAAKSDIVIFPSKYFSEEQCSSSSSNIINQSITWSIKYNLAITITCNLSIGSNALLIDQNGKIILNYTQSPHNQNDPNLTYTTLTTSRSNISMKISILLDDDIFYPELARDLMLQSVELIIYPTNGILKETPDDIIFYTRAFESVAYMVRVNRANESINNNYNIDNGRSAIGSLFNNFEDNIWIMPPINDKQQLIIFGNLNINFLQNTRQGTGFGDAFRRPFRYRQLCGLQSLNTTLIPPTNNDIIVTIAALQMYPGNNVNDNLQIADNFVRKAKQMGADIAFMPEMWSVGYGALFPGYEYGNMNNLHDVYNWISLSSSKHSTFYNYFKQLASNLSIAIGMSYLEDIGNDKGFPPKNSITLFDRNGNEIYTYSKVHTVAPVSCEDLTTPGNEFIMGQLDLGDERGKINVGSMICFDQEFFESARILSQLGVEIIMKPNACPFHKGEHWRLRSKAIENIVGIIMANYAEGIKGFNGNSSAYNWDGSVITEATGDAQVVLGKFNMNEIRKARINNIKRIKSHQILRICDFQRNPAYSHQDAFHRVSGSTI